MTSTTRPGRTGAQHTGRVHLPGPFPLRHGERLRDPVVRWTLTGPDAAPIVVVLGGISADRRPDVWWSDVVGPDRPLDTRRFRVLGIDWLGSSPDSLPPPAGPETRSYPLISTHDQADALMAVLDRLGIAAVRALVGSSYGGMVGLAAASEHPDRIGRLLVISGAHRTHPMATAHRAVQRGILELAGHARQEADGVVLARALAMTTYRTAEEFEARFAPYARTDEDGRFEVEDYLLARGRAFGERFTSRTFAALSHSIDLHRVDPARVTCPVDLVSVDSDRLVPTWLVEELESGLPGPCRHHRLGSPWGHDAFLKEPEAIGSLVADVVREPRSAAVPVAGVTVTRRRLHV